MSKSPVNLTTFQIMHLLQHWKTVKRRKKKHKKTQDAQWRKKGRTVCCQPPPSVKEPTSREIRTKHCKLTRRLRDIKNRERRNSTQTPRPFLNAVRPYHKAFRSRRHCGQPKNKKECSVKILEICTISVHATAILDNAKQPGLPFSLTFLNLRNAFGSVTHHLREMRWCCLVTMCTVPLFAMQPWDTGIVVSVTSRAAVDSG